MFPPGEIGDRGSTRRSDPDGPRIAVDRERRGGALRRRKLTVKSGRLPPPSRPVPGLVDGVEAFGHVEGVLVEVCRLGDVDIQRFAETAERAGVDARRRSLSGRRGRRKRIARPSWGSRSKEACVCDPATSTALAANRVTLTVLVPDRLRAESLSDLADDLIALIAKRARVAADTWAMEICLLRSATFFRFVLTSVAASFERPKRSCGLDRSAVAAFFTAAAKLSVFATDVPRSEVDRGNAASALNALTSLDRLVAEGAGRGRDRVLDLESALLRGWPRFALLRRPRDFARNDRRYAPSVRNAHRRPIRSSFGSLFLRA